MRQTAQIKKAQAQIKEASQAGVFVDSHPLARPRPGFSSWFRTLLAASAVALACAAVAPRAAADAALCAAGASCDADLPDASEARRAWRYSMALQRTGADRALRRLELSDKDYSAFSGVGLISCSIGSATRTSTAFLVGAFDIGVTVAHTFETAPGAPEPECIYNSMDSLGQVRERIPVSYVRSQLDARAGAAGEPAFAVVRLSQPSRYAQRTMPLGRFSGAPAPAVMVGYKQDIDADTVKRKARGTVYSRTSEASAAVAAGYLHDMDSRDLTAGAPVIDERSGVVIGVHTPFADRRNTMITMNDWLEATLRDEMALAKQAEAKVN